MEDLQENEDITILQHQINTTNEKSEAIAHKDNALKRLDVSFNKHIESAEYKKSNILAYWVKDFATYHDHEKTFNPSSLKTFKRGDIIKVNLGFNVGNELGGLHYCVVLDKHDNPYNGNLNIIPLSSAKEKKEYKTSTCIDLGDELYSSLNNKLKNEVVLVSNRLRNLQSNLDNKETTDEINSISDRIKYLNKMELELSKMKHGSFALIHQITTISKQRIYKTPFLSGIKLSNTSLDLIDSKIIDMFTK